MASFKQELLGQLLDQAAVHGIGAWNPLARATRRARRAAKLTNLKTRAASGDQRAIARLQRMQAELNTAALPTTPAVASPFATSTPYVAPSPFATSVPYGTAPTPAPYTPPSPYQSYNPAAYPSSAYNPYGQYQYQQPQPGTPPPAIDVFVGHRSKGEAEEMAAEREDSGGWYGNSFVGGSRKSTVVGNAIPHENYRVAVMKAAVKSAGGGQPSTQDYFKAKAAVDKVIGKSGITIYMPGAKPGRRTI
jgi:hypothetical protein